MRSRELKKKLALLKRVAHDALMEHPGVAEAQGRMIGKEYMDFVTRWKYNLENIISLQHTFVYFSASAPRVFFKSRRPIRFPILLHQPGEASLEETKAAFDNMESQRLSSPEECGV